MMAVIMFSISGRMAFQMLKPITEIPAAAKLRDETREIRDELLKEGELLSEQSIKMEDDSYLESYVRGRFTVSKVGENIFILPAQKKK